MKDALMALSARGLFFFHAALAFWRVSTEMSGNIWVWFLIIPILLMLAEALYGVGFWEGYVFLMGQQHCFVALLLYFTISFANYTF